MSTNNTPEQAEGLRERKQRETRQRIAETGLKLFIEKGYDGTTLDEIAAAADISRRTFFSYFASKEEILIATLGDDVIPALRPTLLEESPDTAPLKAARSCLLKLVSGYETKESIIIDGLLRSTETLRIRKQAFYIQMEQVLFEAMCELWPAASQRDALRIVAMVAIGVLRVVSEKWRQEDAKHPLAHYLRKGFDLLEKQV
jgi:AcrR family transcriptional regulator